MATRYAHSPEDIKHFDTTKLRQEFLMEKIFNAGDILLTYTYNDRMIFGGVVLLNLRWKSNYRKS